MAYDTLNNYSGFTQRVFSGMPSLGMSPSNKMRPSPTAWGMAPQTQPSPGAVTPIGMPSTSGAQPLPPTSVGAQEPAPMNDGTGVDTGTLPPDLSGLPVQPPPDTNDPTPAPPGGPPPLDAPDYSPIDNSRGTYISPEQHQAMLAKLIGNHGIPEDQVGRLTQSVWNARANPGGMARWPGTPSWNPGR